MDALPPDLDAWLGRQPDADGLRQTWALAALAEPARPADTDAAWAQLDAALDVPTAPPSRGPSPWPTGLPPSARDASPGGSPPPAPRWWPSRS